MLQSISITPAYAVASTRRLPSSFSIFPVRRSEFWSITVAATQGSTLAIRPQHRHATLSFISNRPFRPNMLHSASQTAFASTRQQAQAGAGGEPDSAAHPPGPTWDISHADTESHL